MEQIAKLITSNISHGLEIISALVVAMALVLLVKDFLLSQLFTGIKITGLQARVKFGGTVALALELLLGADVLATAVSPSWDDLGKLASIALIRTILNYFLARELKEIHVAPGQ